jgi:hypothetical protein
LVKVASAKQWKAISRKLTINFDDLEEDTTSKEPTAVAAPINQDSPQVPFVQRRRPSTPESFKATTVQQLRRICCQIKPWDQPIKTFAERQLFATILGSPWGVDCDEVYPRIFVGDQATARNIAFLKKYGITHVLNTAEGPWTEHCVDLSAEHYIGSGITYLVSRL